MTRLQELGAHLRDKHGLEPVDDKLTLREAEEGHWRAHALFRQKPRHAIDDLSAEPAQALP